MPFGSRPTNGSSSHDRKSPRFFSKIEKPVPEKKVLMRLLESVTLIDCHQISRENGSEKTLDNVSIIFSFLFFVSFRKNLIENYKIVIII